MGFYVRKSFRMGPVRLNLSKHGLGMSVGVTGARVGVTSEGRAYFHAGRGGLYARHYFGATEAPRSAAANAPVGTVVLYEETDATFATAPAPSPTIPLRERLVQKSSSPLPVHLLLLGAAVLGLLAAGALDPLEAVLESLGAAALVAAWAVLVWRAWLHSRAGEKLGERLAAAARAGTSLSEAQQEKLRTALRDPDVIPADREYQGRMAYLQALQKINDDRVITQDEQRLLTQLEDLCALPEAFRREARLEIFHESYLEAVADHELSEDEERTLQHLRTALAIPDDAIETELGMLEELHEIRRIRGGELPRTEPSVHLPTGETCYCECRGRILKERTLETFQREGQRYRMRGLVEDKEGLLCVTSKRLLLVHDGTTSIRLDKILHVDVDCDQNLITLVRDGRRTPTYLSTPDALRTGAILAAAAGV